MLQSWILPWCTSILVLLRENAVIGSTTLNRTKIKDLHQFRCFIGLTQGFKTEHIMLRMVLHWAILNPVTYFGVWFYKYLTKFWWLLSKHKTENGFFQDSPFLRKQQVMWVFFQILTFVYYAKIWIRIVVKTVTEVQEDVTQLQKSLAAKEW